MLDYLWWLLPSFLKKTNSPASNTRGLLSVFATEFELLKSAILKTRLSKFFSQIETRTNYFETEHAENLLAHAKDRGLPAVDIDTLLRDPEMRGVLGSKQGMKYYLELLIPGIRVDYLYEIGADAKKWLVFGKRDLPGEAQYNRSVLLNADLQDQGEYADYRSTRVYSKHDQNLPEFLFWVKVYNPITAEHQFSVYPEIILAAIDRFKPAHTKGHLVFNYLDPEVLSPWDGQVFIGNNINVSGSIKMVETMANA